MALGMGVEDRIVDSMKQLGFTASDARAYVALLKGYPATGYELAARSGVPRSAIYSVLRGLVGLGLVNVVQEKPAKYQPLAPDRLYDLMHGRFSRTLEDLKTSMSSLANAAPETLTWTVRGYDGLVRECASLIDGAQETVILSAWGREVERLADPLRAAVARDVEALLFSFTPVPADVAPGFSYGIPAEKLERYWSHRLTLVVDNRRVLVGAADLTEDNRAVVTEEEALVEMACSNLVLDITLYGQRTGTDTTHEVSLLTRRLAPVEELVAETLRNGKEASA